MKLQIGDNILEICREIEKDGWTDKEWAEHEADDWFQFNTIQGGYDSDEKAFLFSFYEPEGEW